MLDASVKLSRFKLAPNANWVELRQEPGVDALVGQVAQGVARRAGEGFEARRGESSRRARYYVTPTTPRAFQLNRQHALLRALQAGAR